MKKTIIIIFILNSIFFSFCEDSDIQLSEEKIKGYNENKATVHQREYLNRNNSEITVSGYNDRIVYDIYRGNGIKVKLSTLAFEMNNPYLAKNLIWGEAYNGFMAGLISFSVASALLDVLGIAFTLFQETIYSGKSFNITETPGLIAGISLLSTSVLTIAGMVMFAVFLYKSSGYHFNIIQANSIVNQYNKFLKEKLSLPLNFDVSVNRDNLQLVFGVKL